MVPWFLCWHWVNCMTAPVPVKDIHNMHGHNFRQKELTKNLKKSTRKPLAYFMWYTVFSIWIYVSLMQSNLAIIAGWLLCLILTLTGAFSASRGEVGYYARTDTKLSAIYSAKWFYIPYPGELHICYSEEKWVYRLQCIICKLKGPKINKRAPTELSIDEPLKMITALWVYKQLISLFNG